MQSEQFQELKKQIEDFKQSRSHTRQQYPVHIRSTVSELYHQGLTMNQIASVLGVPYDSVKNWIASIKGSAFKEVKMKSIDRKATNVEKPELFHITISKNGFDLKVENSSTDLLIKILRGL